VSLEMLLCSLAVGTWGVRLENVKCSLLIMALKTQVPRPRIWMLRASFIFPLSVLFGCTWNKFAGGW